MDKILNASRSLYRVICDQEVVGFITAPNADSARLAYQRHGGECNEIRIERLTFGYPEDVQRIYR